MRDSVQLAVNAAVASVTALVSGDVGGVLGAQVGSVLPVLAADAVRRAHARALVVGHTATSIAGFDGARLLEWLDGDPKNSVLLAEVLDAARQATDEEKLRALSRALADGFSAFTPLELNRLRVGAVAAVDPAHVPVLEYLSQPPRPERAGWARDEILERFPHLAAGVDPVLATLNQAGCLVTVSGFGGGSGWQASEFGRDFLEFVRRADGISVVSGAAE